MERLQNISAARLREHLAEAEGKRATLRLVVGINYKEGIPQTTLAEWYGVSRTTIHNWLERLEGLETEKLEDVIYDEPRPGRPTKLSRSQWETLIETLDTSPDTVGYEAQTWTPPLVQQYIEETFEITYTLRHVRELLNRAGYVWNTDSPRFAGGTERARNAFREGSDRRDQ